MKKIIYTLAVAMFLGSFVNAQESKEDRIELTAGLETNHLWRGLIIADKPTVTGMLKVNLDENKHWSAGVWGGAAISNESDGTHYKEIDYFVQYANEKLSIGIWDLFNTRGIDTPEVFNYKDNETTHILDLRTSYYFGDKMPLSLQANVLLYGNDREVEADGDVNQRYSTYVEASYPVYKGKVNLNAFAGAGFAIDGETHLYGNGENKFDVVNVGLKATRNIKIGNFELPVNGMVIWNPSKEYVRMQLSTTLF